ncbi:FAD-dependent oxidoreductase [Paenibacillus koleovorans]|uniref:FAD-dependent oxidoreductase n=1 Tax=Paenibacillus koleovorans TaxID=121608 RepID=UPI001C3FEE07|nr:FAD-dependent oxidoreductase [Paenibacillus koleovorans]
MVQRKQEQFEVIVCGGGLAGFCAAVAAARSGAKTCLIHDRPVFGGNSSSEIRVTPHGAGQFHNYARETGIISELLIEERATNHEKIRENGGTNSVWDMTMYDMAVKTPNLTFHLNTTITDVVKSDKRTIRSVIARVANAETELILDGQIFIDCTGDAIVADQAGCVWRWGSEGRDEFNEPHAPLQASNDTMGSSIHFRARDMGRPVPFTAPDWAVRHEDPDYFDKQGRTFYDLEAGYWWIEIGIPWNTVYDNETIRHELTRHTLGIWDWIKNKDPILKEKARNMALDWIGQVPGKRESRRVIGKYFMTEHDPVNRTVFEDEVAFGGWFIDLHTPGGLLAATAEPASAEGYSEITEYAVKSYCGPYGIPLRIMIAKDVDNLLLAGRNVSVTHAALGTVRVMSTTALMGQAVGTAAALSLSKHLPLQHIPTQAARELQQQLLRDGCFLPSVRNEDAADLARQARATASSSATLAGAGPQTTDATGGFRARQWTQLRLDPAPEPLNHRRGQWIAVGSAAIIEQLSLCVSNDSDQPQTLHIKLVPVDHIWDYRVDTGSVISETILHIPALAQQQWIDWDLFLDAGNGLQPGRYVRLDALANPHVHWHSSGTFLPGHPSAYEMGHGRMRRYSQDGATQSYRIKPAQSCFEPANVLSGVTRPHTYTNVWRSDSREPLSQWLQLDWVQPQTIREVHLTFPGHLLKEFHRYEPLYRDPQCPKDYAIEAQSPDGAWHTLLQVTGNYQRHRLHPLPSPVSAQSLRIVIQATNGDASAAIYEVRCY